MHRRPPPPTKHRLPESYRIRQEANPHNRFDSVRVEWEDGVDLPQALRIHEEIAKSILSKNDSPDIPFKYSLNPYRGCAHACAYCYARPSHEYLGLGAGTDFETRIFAKVNAAELLRAKLSSPSWTGEAITFSGVTDCYQPAESKLKLTRACLEACLEFRNPVSIITKSTLVIRDMDLLARLQEAAGATVVMSIPILDEGVAKILEPFAPPPSLRFRALEKMARNGIKTGISLGPVIPGLNDSDIPTLLSMAKNAGAAFAFYVMLRLPGAVKDVFLERVRAFLPEQAGKIEHHIRETRGGELYRSDFDQRMGGSGKHADMVAQLFEVHARRLGLRSGETLESMEAERSASRPGVWPMPASKSPKGGASSAPGFGHGSQPKPKQKAQSADKRHASAIDSDPQLRLSLE